MEAISKIKAIAENYGLILMDSDVRFDCGNTWYILPWESLDGQGGGIWVREGTGDWHAFNIDSYNIRFIREDDWKMFDEIATALV